MKLHSLSRTTKRKARKRVGRGNGNNWGRTCGRGEKGQMSRSGATHRPCFEGGQIPLIRRLPKRGFTNPNHKYFTLVNVRSLEDNFENGEDVNVDVLAAKHMITHKLGAGLKILGSGELTKKLNVTACAFSESAKAKIEAAGGTCTIGTVEVETKTEQ
ncbi:50S ribosomal protein L15 [bacterium M21]|nr:50S ribosomal protein L15 [bacterium M21]